MPGLCQGQEISPARWYCVPPHAVGAGQTARPRVIGPSFGRCCVPPHATGAGQTERPRVIGPPPSSLTLWGRILGRAGGIQGFARQVPTVCSVPPALGVRLEFFEELHHMIYCNPGIVS